MKIILNNRKVEQIPVLEYYQEDIEYKSLVFVQHGYESTKEYGCDFLAVNLARQGYFVVAIDGYKHGERIAEPYITGTAQERLDEAFVVVKRTALDIIRLHHNAYFKRFPTFDVIGISLGGMVAYYLATRTRHVRTLIPVISTPDFLDMAYYAVTGAGGNTDEYFTEEKLDFIHSINPMERIAKLHYQSMHLFVGTSDPVVPYQPSKAFFAQYHREGDTYHEYDVDHNVPREMQLDIVAALDQN